jgi:hypothetical protein
MDNNDASALDHSMARICGSCPVCRSARRNQQGLANLFVRGVEVHVCPFCRAYERVHGRKAHESLENT